MAELLVFSSQKHPSVPDGWYQYQYQTLVFQYVDCKSTVSLEWPDQLWEKTC